MSGESLLQSAKDLSFRQSRRKGFTALKKEIESNGEGVARLIDANDVLAFRLVEGMCEFVIDSMAGEKSKNLEKMLQVLVTLMENYSAPFDNRILFNQLLRACHMVLWCEGPILGCCLDQAIKIMRLLFFSNHDDFLSITLHCLTDGFDRCAELLLGAGLNPYTDLLLQYMHCLFVGSRYAIDHNVSLYSEIGSFYLI